ncbi:hypothetical protein B9Z55_007723 [Caenorhabditis nigoni]|uniref:BTB domain-containing protein n=1 Tax=Caenorhabditis nigoni TaxID=1611254 RepID=A0A2G5VB85_9PELO|nr:hypothetical protein B9Z55_007723 [Caenorhabditis nigoni]
MVTNEEGSIGNRTEPEDTAETSILEVAQKSRSELIAVTEDIKKNQEEMLHKIECKYEEKIEKMKRDYKEKLDEQSNKLQLIEESISKLVILGEAAQKSKDDPTKEPISELTVSINNTTNVASKTLKRFQLKHIFKGVSNFKEMEFSNSKHEDHYNVKWYMSVRRKNGRLGFYVHCQPIAPSEKWSIQTKLEYTMIGRVQNDNIIRTFDYCYEKAIGWGFHEFLEWKEMKKWFLVDGNLQVEAKVTIFETTGLAKTKVRKFDESQKDVSDVILVVGDTKFYVSKMFLAAQSSVFKALLLGSFKESKQSEVTHDFHYFLEVLYGEPVIDESNVGGIVFVADMYDAPTAIGRIFRKMAANEEGSIGNRTESEATTETSMLEVAQNPRSELIAETEDSKKNQEEMLQNIESMIDNKIEKIKKVYDQKFDEQSNKLQLLEESISKLSKSIENAQNSQNASTKETISEPTACITNTTKVDSKTIKRFKLKHVLKNVSNFKENVEHLSEKEDYYNTNWSIAVQRHKNDLGFYVHCEPITPADKWSIRAKLEFKVVGPNENDVIKTWDYCYKSKGAGFCKFLDWEEMKKWYLVDGNLTLEVNGEIIETTGFSKEKIRKFDESQKNFSDVILVVEDTKFYVSKMFLAAQSSVFNALLLGNFSESKQSEVKLNGIDPDDFHYFLEVLYGESAIDDTTVEGVALLADMYDAPTAIRKCEEFLLKESKKTSYKKLKIATRYNLEKLKDMYLW